VRHISKENRPQSRNLEPTIFESKTGLSRVGARSQTSLGLASTALVLHLLINRNETHMSHAICPSPLVRRLAFALLIPLFLTGGILRAQDAVRPSLAGEAAAEARRQEIDKIPYNLQVGPIKFRFSATMGIEYNDNINLAEDGTFAFPSPLGPISITTQAQDDIIFHPQINLDALWPVTQLNTLRLDLGIGYSFYLDHSNYNTNSIL